MSDRDNYDPGPARGVEIEKDGDIWTLAMVREFKHSPEKIWQALTDPVQLKEWSPFDADTNMGVAGVTVKLTTIGAPQPHVTETTITRAEPPHILEYSWNGNDTRWELDPNGDGTHLKLWAKIDKKYIAMGAAGWHICLEVMDRYLDGNPIGRMVGMDTMKFEGWQRLNKEYSAQFGVLVN
jgi:uncharacterized protein YndB with AHSA1/START domain